MKKIILPRNHPVQARVYIPGSKSITNRALLLAALSDGVCEISDILISDDTRTFINALHALGIMVQLDEKTHSCIVGGGSGFFPKKEASIWCAEAGTVARFLLAACASSSGSYHFDAAPSLKKRPLFPLLKVLLSQGALVTPANATELPFTIQGIEGLMGGEVEIDASQSGQYISALLMVAPFATSIMTIQAHALVSRPYVEMTCAMMGEFGVMVRRMQNLRFSVPVPQRYKARDYVVEPDLSTASYFFAAAAVTGGQVTIQAIRAEKSLQADAKFLTILEKMGCEIIENEMGLSVKGPSELQGVSVNMQDCSDTFMTLAALAPFAKTPTTITNIGHVRLQESDRLAVMREGLEKLKISVEEGPDWLKIYPGVPQKSLIDPHHDHRIAMAFSVIGLVSGVEIENAECVSKTCPNFFELWEQL